MITEKELNQNTIMIVISAENWSTLCLDGFLPVISWSVSIYFVHHACLKNRHVFGGHLDWSVLRSYWKEKDNCINAL